MQNELLSPAVAAGSFAIASLGLGVICNKAKKFVTHDKLAMMGLMGAFVFAGQMVNIPLPFLPGTSGHITGAVLLAILLSPYAAAIVMSSVVIVQCLIFQDGGIMAIGCNLINIAIVPSFLGHWIYTLCMRKNRPQLYNIRTSIAVMLACEVAVVFPSALIPVQAGLSGVLVLPFRTFLTTMLGVHAVIGLLEGLITVAIFAYLHKVCPDIFETVHIAPQPEKRRKLYTAIVIATVIVGAGLSIIASSLPDGLEWSYADRPDQPEFTRMTDKPSGTVEQADQIQEKYSIMPDYNSDMSNGWKSFAGVAGSAITMAIIWIVAFLIRRKELPQNASHSH